VTKPDDGMLSAEQLSNVQRHADRLLRAAAAYGRFPTPIPDLLAEARLTVVEDEFLDAGLLQRLLRRVSVGVATLKSALTKIIGLFEPHDRLVVIDKGVPLPRKPFIKLHEAGHGFMPHQAEMYSLMQDCEKTLDPDTTDLFEREANVFASEVLFQGSAFAEEANAEPFGVKVPMRLAKKFGGSNYSSFRRYVSTNHQACCLIVIEPISVQQDGTFTAHVRRIVASRTFQVIYDSECVFRAVGSAHPLSAAIPTGRRRMTPPTDIVLQDRNREARVCLAEAFNTGHQILALVRDVRPVNTFLIIVPGSTDFAASASKLDGS
jgi:IrrE N-terminal-like domain